MMKSRTTSSFDEWLSSRLKDPKKAVAYLNEHLIDDGEDDFEALLLLALRDIARAHGIDKVADTAKLNRESLYKTLSRRGNPRLRTFTSLLGAMGLELRVARKVKRKIAVG
jgi:probable addiction module antidote protein